MSELDQTIAERVAEVAEDLELQAGFKLRLCHNKWLIFDEK